MWSSPSILLRQASLLGKKEDRVLFAVGENLIGYIAYKDASSALFVMRILYFEIYLTS